MERMPLEESLISYPKSLGLRMLEFLLTDRSSDGFHQPNIHGPQESKAIFLHPIGLPNYPILNVLSEILRGAGISESRKILATIPGVPSFDCPVN